MKKVRTMFSEGNFITEEVKQVKKVRTMFREGNFITEEVKQVKKVRTMFSMALMVSILGGLFAVAIPVSAESVDLTDTSKYECVGALTENFDGIEDVDALYQASGDGVLSGAWRLTELSAWGQGTNEIKTPDGGSKVLNMTSTENWAKPGGVDFVFKKPLAPEYILDISYDMHFDSSDTVTEAAALFSNGNFDAHDNAGIGRHMGDHTFQIINGNEQGKAAVGTWNQCTSETITVKAVYNLYAWTYNAEIFLDGNLAASMTDGIIGPSSWDKDDTCKPGSTYEKLSFVVQVGTAYVDNISIKAYRIKSDIIGFTKNGKTVTNLTEGDTLNVGFSLIDAPSADGDETCLVAFYDAQDRLLSVSMQDIPVKAGYGFCISNDAVTVPVGAHSARAFVWHLADITPLAYPVTLSKK